jgi:hypothetical protein
MDYDFQIGPDALRIPTTAYKPVKRCPFCQSVFIDENSCDACGRSMHYHLIGAPFSPKSFYGIKERYIESLNVFNRFFPQFENKKSIEALSYVRKLSKRFADLVSAFNSTELMATSERKLFYIESMELIDELLRYGTASQALELLLEENDNSSLGRELLYYVKQSSISIVEERSWIINLLNYRLWGLVRVEYFLKVVLVSATVITMAVKYKEIISSQFGK